MSGEDGTEESNGSSSYDKNSKSGLVDGTKDKKNNDVETSNGKPQLGKSRSSVKIEEDEFNDNVSDEEPETTETKRDQDTSNLKTTSTSEGYVSRWRGPQSIRKNPFQRVRKPRLRKPFKGKVIVQSILHKIWMRIKNILGKIPLISRLPWFTTEETGQREIIVGNRESRFASNSVSTTKYGPITFIPKNLYEQFKRLANIWFLIVALIQLIPGISPLNPASSIVPLVFVLGVTAVKEALEDIRRRVSDTAVNNRKTHYWNNDWTKIAWKNVKVGDLLKLEKDEMIPADMLLLATSETNGIAYLETADLDGETNLKVRQALEATEHIHHEDHSTIVNFKATVNYEPPNAELYKFEGALDIQAGGNPDAKQKIRKERESDEEEQSDHEESIKMQEMPKSPDDHSGHLSVKVDQTLWRGTTLRNTQWAIGVVLFTGMQSKIMKNARDPPSKRSSLEIEMNRTLFQIFMFALVLDFFGGLWAGIWVSAFGWDMWYLNLEGIHHSAALFGLIGFPSWLILLNVIIPISLYVYMEVVKIILAVWIGWDKEMYDEKTDTRAKANTSNLTEELGQIEFVFSDKTGTLTQNSMEFKRVSISGIAYGAPLGDEGMKKLSKELDRAGGGVDQGTDVLSDGTLKIDDYIYSDPRLQKMFEKEDDTVMEFFRVLAVCHSVLIQKDEKTGEPIYQAASPDEEALVLAAKKLGFELKGRKQGKVIITVKGKEETWPILNIMEFNSDRKRMSVVVRDPNTDEVKLYCKGADNMIFERLADGQDKFKADTLAHLGEFAVEGLRTLGVSFKIISEDEYSEWAKKYHAASIKVKGREAALDEVAEEIEKNMTLLGATAIEDKLQEGVPEAIATILKAGIKMWVLTGDKMETAINIGYSCCLLDNDIDQIVFSAVQLEDEDEGGSNSFEQHPITAENASEELEARIKYYFPEMTPDIDEELGDMELQKREDDRYSNKNPFRDPKNKKERKKAIVIDGSSLKHYLKPTGFDALSLRFLELAMRCKVVICCRVSPLQKALVVRLVKTLLQAVTLSIGDGANDVPMIQEAQVGVGISGKEGTQAVMNADYAIAQFRFLTRLLLVHGTWSYRRMCTLLLYSFYKNIVFALPNYWFGIWAAYAAQSLFDSWAVSVYNILYTGLPILVVAIFDRPIEAQEMYDYPELYKRGILGKDFTTQRFWIWQGTGIIQGILITYFGIFAFWEGDVQSNGWTHGVYSLGTAILNAVIWVVSFKIVLITNTWTIFNILALSISLFLWYGFLVVYTLIPDNTLIDPNELYRMIYTLFASPFFWLYPLLMLGVCSAPDLAFKYLRRSWFPQDYHIIQERKLLKNRGLRRMHYLRRARRAMLLKPFRERKENEKVKRESQSMLQDTNGGAGTNKIKARKARHTGFAFSQDPGQRDLMMTMGVEPISPAQPKKNKKESEKQRKEERKRRERKMSIVQTVKKNFLMKGKSKEDSDPDDEDGKGKQSDDLTASTEDVASAEIHSENESESD